MRKSGHGAVAAADPKRTGGLADYGLGLAAFERERQAMATGTVKWFNADKGFGFIQPQDGDKDVFVHITAVQAAGLQGLNDGQKVSYDVVAERGKQAAANLKLV
jgi:CspA family cold shock protein